MTDRSAPKPKDKPPRKRKPTHAGLVAPSKIAGKIQPLIDGACLAAGLRWPDDAAVVAAHSAELADALAAAAKESVPLHRFIHKAVIAGAWTPLASVCFSIALGIIANHNPGLLASLQTAAHQDQPAPEETPPAGAAGPSDPPGPRAEQLP